jgi:hypothetical protein
MDSLPYSTSPRNAALMPVARPSLTPTAQIASKRRSLSPAHPRREIRVSAGMRVDAAEAG